MLRAELEGIYPLDYGSWEEFAQAEHAESWDNFGWFRLDVGVEGELGSTDFQALITTPLAKSRAKDENPGWRILVVQSFEPEALMAELRSYIGSVTGATYTEIVEQLRRNAYWEYEALNTRS
ncbi:MAG TPA: Imm8 family immunity protein [Armatimonadota bacterium]|nr:Imm8 family immunity protein [Armatimonadota bacterium]